VRTFSFKRFAALLRKEWLQILRDPITLRFIIALPMMQLFLFGYAINTDPKHLPAGLLSVNHSKYERSLIAALQNTGYYDISMLSSEAEAERALAQGELLFVITIPANFDRSVDRGDAPSVLIDADASDPTAVANATAALPALSTALNRDLPPIRQVQSPPLPFQIVVHARYNPERLTVLNVVPGLICIVLIFSTVFVTALSITRERERGTMENLLAMPVRPIEVMLAKVVPYILVGYVQVVLILIAATLVFRCRFAARCHCCSAPLGSSSPAISRLGLRSRHSQQTRCRRSSSPSLRSCRRFSCRASSFRSRGCPSGRNGWAKSSPRRIR
jgi:ABC-type Na+ efflux pump permease subunit